MRRLTKIKQSIYEPEYYAVYVSKDGEQYSGITMTANQIQQVLDKLAMYEDLDACGLVAKKPKNSNLLRRIEAMEMYDEYKKDPFLSAKEEIDTVLEMLKNLEKELNKK